ncbi:Fic family protein [Verrucomicrobiota bacterium]
MPKKISEEYFKIVIRSVAEFQDGAAIQEILDTMDCPPPRRTFQRHLAKLVRGKRLSFKGKGRAIRYYVPGPLLEESAEIEDSDKKSVSLPLSAEAIIIKKKVTAPFSNRTPVGYNRAFLDAYSPNKTYYLSSDIRKLLKSLGSVSEDKLPAGTYLREIYNRVMIDLSWNSSRLEGNTYSLLETQRLIDLGETAEGKNAEEAQMILNHKAAIELLSDESADIGFNRYTILNLHAVLSDNLLSDPQACGRVRSRGVGVTGTVFHPLEMPQMIEECFNIILRKASTIKDAFEQAFFVMVQVPYLQPFEDVNKRVSRIAANIPLIRMNLCPLSFVDVPEDDYARGMLGVYELNAVEYLRDVFVWAYKRSCERYSAVRQSLGEPDLFRLKHRSLIKNMVCDVVKGCMSKKTAVAFTKHAIPETLSIDNHKRLLEIVETELSSLHEGNIARYRLKPSEYKAWIKDW